MRSTTLEQSRVSTQQQSQKFIDVMALSWDEIQEYVPEGTDFNYSDLRSIGNLVSDKIQRSTFWQKCLKESVHEFYSSK